MSYKVSVIIPNYNHEQYLPKRIESILDQTYQDFEIIILDDCSKDSSREVIARYAEEDSRIRVFFNEQNSGNTFKQWNKGLTKALGKYVWIAESDDYADPLFLERLVERLDTHPIVGLAYCQSWKINEHNETIHSMKEFTNSIDKERWNQNYINKGKAEIYHYLLYANTIPNASAVLFRKSIFESVGKVDEDLKVSGDWFFYIELLLRSDIAYVSDHLNYFRFHDHTVRSDAIASNTVYQEFISLYDKLNVLFLNHSDSYLKGVSEDFIKKNLQCKNEFRGKFGFMQIKNGDYKRGFKNIIYATMYFKFSTFYLKNGLYWFKESLKRCK